MVTWTSARELCARLQQGRVSAVDVMQEVYARIERVNPQVNALVNLLPLDDALKLAEQADQVDIAHRGLLHGLPMAPKDAVEVKGFPTTWGFSPWAQRIAQQDDEQARRLRAAGAIFIGHSNMPEFGLGSNTFNSIFGKTLNPYNLNKTAGGSSGGAAVALATQMLPLADGSDMGGSLRNPASFCNVVGLRPSVGRVPNGRAFSWLARLGITGPMARNVADLALLFSVQAGPDHTDPITLPEPGETFFDAYEPLPNLQGLRIANITDALGVPIEHEVLDVLSRCQSTLQDLGARLTNESPDLSQAMQVFQTQRAATMAPLGHQLDRTVPDWRSAAKDTAIWNIEKGQQIDAQELLQSELQRSQIYAEVAEFMQDYDAMILPAAQVVPFDVNQEWVEQINNEQMDTYIDWMTVCCAITVTGLPAISIPGGFSQAGLPIGLQIVGKPRGDLALLRLAHTFEQATQHYQTLPQVSAV